MHEIRALCLSDLHLGADNSLLTALDPDGRADPLRAPETLRAFGASLRALVADQPRPVTLILNGDVLEQALATTNQAAMAFDRFLEALYPPGEPARFSDQLLYLPGNHDHHQWQTTRDALSARMIEDIPVGQPIPRPRSTLPLVPEAAVQAQLMTALMRRHRGLGGATARLSYPDLGLRFPGGRAVVFHHGHYLESIYRLVSHLRDLLFPGQRPAETIEDIEEENGAWMDFFWSMLGRSGVAGRDVNLLYASVQDPVSSRALAEALGRALAEQTKESALLDWAEEKVLGAVFRWLLARAARAAAGERDEVLGADDEEGLRWYLGGPLRRALEPGGAPERLGFVFGHTHRPFSRLAAIAPWAAPVELMNTGGWVIDAEDPGPAVGGSAVLVDAAGQLVNLRAYNVVSGGAPSVARAEALTPEAAAFREAVEARLAATPEPWRALSSAIAESAPYRERVLRRMDRRTARALDPEDPP